MVPGNDADAVVGPEPAGVVELELGDSADFEAFRTVVADIDAAWHHDVRARRRRRRTSFPTLLDHGHDEWTWPEAASLLHELAFLREVFERMPARPFAPGTWQASVAADLHLEPTSLAESFIDMDGRCVIDGLEELAAASVALHQPIRCR